MIKQIKRILSLMLIMYLICGIALCYAAEETAEETNLIASEYSIDNQVIGALPKLEGNEPSNPWETGNQNSVFFDMDGGNQVISVLGIEDAQFSYDYLGKIPPFTMTQVWDMKVKLPTVEHGEVSLFKYHRGYSYGDGEAIVLKGGKAYTKDLFKSTDEFSFAEGLEAGRWYTVRRIINTNLSVDDAAAVQKTKNFIFDDAGELVGSTGGNWVKSGGVSTLTSYDKYKDTGVLFSNVTFNTKDFREEDKVYFDDFAVYDADFGYTMSEKTPGVRKILAYNPIDKQTAFMYRDTGLHFNDSEGYKKFRRYKIDFKLPETDEDDAVTSLLSLNSSEKAEQYYITVSNGVMQLFSYVGGIWKSNPVTAIGSTGSLFIENETWYSIAADMNVESGEANLVVKDASGIVLASQEFTCKPLDVRSCYVSYISTTSYGDGNRVYFTNFGEEAWADCFDGESFYYKSFFDGTTLDLNWHGKDKTYGPMPEGDLQSGVTNVLGNANGIIYEGRWMYWKNPAGLIDVVEENFLLSKEMKDDIVISLNFKTAVDPDTLAYGVKLYKDDTEVFGNHTSSLENDNRQLLITFNSLEAESVYTLAITENLKSLSFGITAEEFYFTFKETPAFVTSMGSKLVKIDGETETEVTATQKNDVIKAKMDVKNISTTTRTYLLLAGIYKGEELVTVNASLVDIEQGQGSVSTEAFSVPDDGCVIRVSLWDSWRGMTPVGAAAQFPLQ